MITCFFCKGVGYIPWSLPRWVGLVDVRPHFWERSIVRLNHQAFQECFICQGKGSYDVIE